MGIRNLGRLNGIGLTNPVMARVSLFTLFLTSFATFAGYVTNLIWTMPGVVVAASAPSLILAAISLYLLVVASALWLIDGLARGHHGSAH